MHQTGLLIAMYCSWKERQKLLRGISSGHKLDKLISLHWLYQPCTEQASLRCETEGFRLNQEPKLKEQPRCVIWNKVGLTKTILNYGRLSVSYWAATDFVLSMFFVSFKGFRFWSLHFALLHHSCKPRTFLVAFISVLQWHKCYRHKFLSLNLSQYIHYIWCR